MTSSHRRRWTPATRRLAAAAAVATAATPFAVHAALADTGTALTAQYTAESSWGTGATGGYLVGNPDDEARSWTLEFDLPDGVTLTSLWGGTADATTGHVTVTPPSWSTTLAAGASTTVGFVMSGGADAPTGCLIDGAACDGDGDASTGTAPTATVTTTSPAATAATTTADDATTSTSASASASTSAAASAGSGDELVSPYVDTSLYPSYDLMDTVDATGVDHFTLAFVVSDGGCSPAFGGVTAVADDPVAAQIDELRAAGGDVRVSFGGAAGSELALACSDADALADAYAEVLDTLDVTAVDFDVEGSALADTAANARRAEAVAQLQSERDLDVSLTLPVLPTGLTTDGTAAVGAMADAGVDLGSVNIMAMDYGDGVAPDPDGQMGDYAAQAAEATVAQVAPLLGVDEAGAWTRLAVTPMIGVNDVSTEVFRLDDAAVLVALAQQHSMARLSFWSATRDRACSDGSTTAQATCSGIVQDDLAFTKAFAAYTG